MALSKGGIIAIVVVAVAAIAIGGYYIYQHFEDGNVVNGSWTFTLEKTTDSSNTYAYDGSLDMVVSDGKVTQYSKDIDKTELIKQPDGSYTLKTTGVKYNVPSKINLPEPILTPSSEVSDHFKKMIDKNPFLDGFGVSGYTEYYRNNSTQKVVETYRLNNNTLLRQYYCDWDGNIYSVVDKSDSSVDLKFILDGWTKTTYEEYQKSTK